MKPNLPDLLTLTRDLAHDRAPQLLALINSLPGRPWTEAELLVPLTDKFRYSRIWMTGDQVVGVVLASRKHKSVHIHQIVLEAAYRRLGLGRKVYRQIAAQAEADGLTLLTAHCLLDDMGALAFHTTLGLSLDSQYDDPQDGSVYGRLSVPLKVLLETGTQP